MTAPPLAPPPPLSALNIATLPLIMAPVPSVLDDFDAPDTVATTHSNKQEGTPSKFSSVLGSLPGPQQFLISDSPGKDEDVHSWDGEEEDVADAEPEVGNVIAFAAEPVQESGWDSEPDEPAPKQPGLSEGKAVDHGSWDSDEEGETKVERTRCRKLPRKPCVEDPSMEDLDDLVGEVLDGQRRLP